MIKTILATISAVIETLQKYRSILKSKYKSALLNDNFSSLSPIADADKDGHYTDALNWALRTRSKNDIRNIAITGPYGSGKSSVLKTFQNKNDNSNLHFLNISLATFKEEILDDEAVNNKTEDQQSDKTSILQPIINKGDTNNKTNSADLIRLIELSILQQIFYHANDSEIPDSRFKKIKRVNNRALRIKSVATLLLIFSVLFLWRESIPSTILNVINEINPIYLLITGVTYLLGTCYLLALSIQGSEEKTFNVKVPILLLIVSLLLIFYVAVNEILKWNYVQLLIPATDIVIKTLEVLALCYTAICILLASYNLVKYISRVSINKLKFQDTEIEIDSKISKSILNHHLDEILYFFEATNYNVVIIEDLDRFQQTEIFTKLREINLLLNNSKKTKGKEIVFIYAVRDDMFTDKERSKFFDFIIPIIPVINSANSSQKLLDKNNKYNYGWTEDLIDSLSIYIDDMRLLHNICNEFEIYRNKLTNKLDRNKLLAIIVYKNLFPNDFTKLNDNEGTLWKAINSKQTFIAEQTIQIDSKIQELSLEISELEKLKITDTGELRKLYLMQYINNLENFESFSINNLKKNIEEMCLEENFNYLVENKARQNYFTHRYNGQYLLQSNQSIKITFEQIEIEVDKNHTYRQRLSKLNNWSLGRINTIREQIQALEQKKTDLRRSKLKEILSNNSTSLPLYKDIKQNKLVYTLLRHGYIEEDYHDFTSVFYEGTLTKGDNDFLISVKNQEPLDFSYELKKFDTLIKKINQNDFAQHYTLNFSLLTFLLKDEKKHAEILTNVFQQLKNSSKTSADFIFKYIDTGEKIEKFIARICKEWSGIWKHIEDASNIPNENKEIYLKHILSFADSKDIGTLAKDSNLKYKVENDKNFLSIIPDSEKLKLIIAELICDFEDLDFEKSPPDLLYYVYENWNYKISTENIASFIKRYGSFDQSKFDTSNYAAIMTSECRDLIDYIDANMESYIKNVYLKIDTNNNEEEEYLTLLLNNKTLSVDSKNKLISQNRTIIHNLTKITKTELYSLIISENKIDPNWNNVQHAFFSLKTDDADSSTTPLPKDIIDFLNHTENNKKLSETKTPIEGELKDRYIKLWEYIIYGIDIQDEAYSRIIRSCPWWYDNLDFSKISKEKVKLLINNSRVLPNEKSYEALKESQNGLNIYLLEKRKIDFFKILNNIQFDSEDIELILRSEHLTSGEKFKIIDHSETEVLKTSTNLKLLVDVLNTNPMLKVSDEILESILLEGTIETKERLKLFIKNQSKYGNEFIEQLVDSLDTRLSKINDKSVKAKIPRSEVNLLFLKILEKRGYISSFSDREKDIFYMVNHKRK